MNWKKWDENGWINMSNGHLLIIYTDSQGIGVLYFMDGERRIGNKALTLTKNFKERADAVAFIEELIRRDE